MPETSQQGGVLDVIIIGAGPAGLSVGIEAKRAGLSYAIIEKGALANSILHYPTEMKFFSTAPLLEIGGVPFTTPNANPSRLEGLAYYRRVAEHFDLAISFEEEVISLSNSDGVFEIATSKRTLRGLQVVLATGYFDNPKQMSIPGEELPMVSHYYTEGHSFFRRDVIVIGGKNSSAEAALDLYRHGANVTMVIRKPELGKNVKFWLKPNLENRIKDGSIKAYFNAEVRAFEPGVAIIESQEKGSLRINCDHVFALTGYQPDVALLKRFGIEVEDGTLIPKHNPDTFETNVPGLFIAGSVACGCETGTIFIENGRLHAYTIMGVIKRRLADIRKTRMIE